MAVYAVGDVQGCAVALEELLDDLNFDPARDKLWLVGDLVNRGPRSLQTLRMIRRFGDAAISVLGNHDLHLLAVASGIKPARSTDTLKEILRAPDRDELMHWLRHLPMVHADRELRTLMVHAGVYPGWKAKQLFGYAREVEAVLRSNDYKDFLAEMYGRRPIRWKSKLKGHDRTRFLVNTMTRMRYVTRVGSLNFSDKGPPGSQPSRLVPWYLHPELRCKKWRIVFGHWSALGFMRSGRVIGLDSGCVWGGALSAVRLDSENQRNHWQVGCPA